MNCLIETAAIIFSPQQVRRVKILAAAEHCFVRAGFHKTTMQDVAAEARMSAGNVYRYFPSKDAIVAGLVARDRAEVAAGFERLRADDPIGSLAAMVRREVVACGRETAVLRLEICAEATRNPAVAAVMDAYEAEVVNHLVSFFEAVPTMDGADGRLGPRALAELVITFLGGVMVNQAMGSGPEEAERRLADLLAIVQSALDGRLTLAARVSSEHQP